MNRFERVFGATRTWVASTTLATACVMLGVLASCQGVVEVQDSQVGCIHTSREVSFEDASDGVVRDLVSRAEWLSRKRRGHFAAAEGSGRLALLSGLDVAVEVTPQEPLVFQEVTVNQPIVGDRAAKVVCRDRLAFDAALSITIGANRLAAIAPIQIGRTSPGYDVRAELAPNEAVPLALDPSETLSAIRLSAALALRPGTNVRETTSISIVGTNRQILEVATAELN